MKTEYWFPTIIGWADCEFHIEIQDDLIQHCFNLQKEITSGGQGWISKHTYNTENTYNILNDNKFKRLNDWIHQQVEEYKNHCQYKNNFKADLGWFNIYKQYDFQEYHIHPGHSLSVIYYLKSDPKTSAKTWFESPQSIDSNDPKTDNNFLPTCKTAIYESTPGRLLIFRSNTRHCVERQETDDTRITLAYNFKIDDRSKR